MHTIVFTDLDGSLLDESDYSFEEARPALNRIREQQVPLIFTTSKTRQEVEHLQAKMQIQEPFIVENGAAIFFPDNYRGLRIDTGFRQKPYTVVQLGAPYGEIRRFIYSVRRNFKIRGFGDLTVDDVVELSGLNAQQAACAKRREFTEPFLMEDVSAFAALEKVAEAKGFKITRGGRFFHLIGIRQDKGAAARITASIFSKNAGRRLVSIGLGDSANDIPMLQSVDIPVLIPRPNGLYLKVSLPNLRKASQPGSRGWNEIMLQLLDPSKSSGNRKPVEGFRKSAG
jgi:mannosyl-3-phosphoglycerate phosphatase